MPLKSLRLLGKSCVSLLQQEKVWRPSYRGQTCLPLPKILQKHPKPNSFLAGAVWLEVLAAWWLTPPVPSASGNTTGPRSPLYPTLLGSSELLNCAANPTSVTPSCINIVSSPSYFLTPFFSLKDPPPIFPCSIITSCAFLNTKAAGCPACRNLRVLRERRKRAASSGRLTKGCAAWCGFSPCLAPRRAGKEEVKGSSHLLQPSSAASRRSQEDSNSSSASAGLF